MENNLVKTEDKINISFKYTDEFGSKLDDPINATRQEIFIRKDRVLVSKTEKFTDTKPFGENEKDSLSAYGYEKGDFVLSKVEEIKDILFENISKRTLNKLTLSIIGLDSSFKIDEDVMSLIFYRFPTIDISFNNDNSGGCIVLPFSDISCKSISINGGKIILLNEGTSIKCSSSISIENSLITTSSSYPMLSLISPKTYLSNIIYDSPVKTNILAPHMNSVKEFKETSITLSSIREDLNLYNLSNENEEGTGVFKDALFNLSDVNSLNINDFYIYGAPYYKGIKAEKISNVNISYIYRIVKDVNPVAYALGFGSCSKINVSNFSETLSRPSENGKIPYFIFLDGQSFDSSNSISIMDGVLRYVNLCNLDSLKMSEVYVSSLISENSDLFTCDEQTVTNVYIDDSDISLYNLDLILGKIKVNSSSISILKNILNTADNSNIKLEALNGIQFKESKIYGNGYKVSLIAKNGCDILFRDSTVNARALIISHPEIDDYLLKLNIVDERSRILDIRDSAFIINEEFDVSDMWEMWSRTSSFTCGKIKIKGVGNLFSDTSSALKCNGITVPIEIEDTGISNLNIRVIDPPEFQHLDFVKCPSGNVNYLLSSNELDKKCDVKLGLTSSRLQFMFDTEGMSGTVKVKSDNSSGSTIYSKYSNVEVVPDLESLDREKFYQNYGSSKNNDLIYYGTSSEKVSLDRFIGL